MAKRDGNRARLVAGAVVATAIALAALARRPRRQGYRQSPGWRLYDGTAQAIDRTIGWDRLPTPLGLLVLVGLRNLLRKHNLHDTSGLAAVDTPPVPPFDPSLETARNPDGTHNDLQHPSMGMAGSRFGRNIPIERTFPESVSDLLDPSPREVSRILLTRPDGQIQAAEAANALVAAWLQFMIRDWFSHGKSPTDHPWQIQLADDDSWPQRPMRIMRTRPDPTRPAGTADLAPTYVNTETPWWDGSQLYGNSKELQELRRARSDGKLRIGPDGLPPHPTDPEHDPTRVPGFWLGLALLHNLFALEHNAICDRLRAEYPSWSDDELFERARLVNAALLAKIHTVEWTPVVISHPTTKVALPANWWGLAGERLHRLVGRFSSSEVVSGIPGSATQHFGVPYSLTEEFVAVYRMHPLVPDDYDIRSVADDHRLEAMTLRDLSGPNVLDILARIPMADLLYSFGTIHPGLVTLHNYPRFLQQFERPDGKGLMDLAATDILRIRELGVPRYNEFRRLLRLSPARDFESLTDNSAWAEELRRVYRDDIERVDLMVGMFAERRPKGFAFSDTAFRIFILMASRRLNSDRFLTRDYIPEVYTPAGLDWIERSTMSTVLLRHYPQLRPTLRSIPNAFMAWSRPTAS
jgi:Animal haem peroxidase